MNFLDTITVPLDLAEDARLERVLRGQRPGAGDKEVLPTIFFGARLPLLEGRDGGEIARGVEVFDLRGLRGWRVGGQGDLQGAKVEEEGCKKHRTLNLEHRTSDIEP